MTEPVIRAQNLGKRYRIGALQERHATLGAELMSRLRRPFKRMSSIFHPQIDSSDRVSLSREPDSPNTVWAVSDVSFEINQGEAVGIIGRNGAGKSTLLKILSRITKPTVGRVELTGRVGSLLEVGTGFHSELTGRENIYLNGAILGMKRAEIVSRFDEIVAFADVEKFIDTPVKHYSSGMYLRLAFAVAAHLDPEILLVDEVLAVGDATFQRKCLGKMSDVTKQGRTVLLVGHNMAAIAALCSRSIYLEGGRIQFTGDTYEAIAQYFGSGGADLVDSGTSGSMTLEKRNSQAWFKRLTIIDELGHVTSNIPMNLGFKLRIEYCLDERITETDLLIEVHDTRGWMVLYSSLIEELPDSSRPYESGSYVVEASFPPHFLMPRTYTLTLALHKRTYQMYDFRDHVMNFTILNAGFDSYYSTRRDNGVVRAKLPWSRPEIIKK